MFRLRLQKIGSLLGLLAILMSALAPTVSQALAAHDRLGIALATYCSADGDTDARAGSQPGKSSHSSALHGQACAYCGLLAHFPVLPNSATTFVADQSAARAPDRVVRETVRVPLLYRTAQPRAPPAFS